MKGLGAFLLVLTGLGFGCSARHTLRRRVVLVEQTERLLRYLSDRIRCTAAPLSTLLCSCAAQTDLSVCPLLTDTVEKLGENGEFREAWTAAVETQRKALSLTDEDCALLTQAVCSLGSTDIEGEIRQCDQYAERLRECVR